MGEPVDHPPQDPPLGYNALQYLIGAAAGCVIASFIAVGIVIWLAQSGALSADSWQTVITVAAASPVMGAVCGILVLARTRKHS
jgi:hypothetical protein